MWYRADTIADPMDKKLLLAIQFACNSTGVAVPWDRVGAIMGPEISSGAVIQHLAKVRVRLIELGLPVPPPLRRGGGSARTAIAANSPKKAGVTKKKAPKANSTRKKVEHNSDESDDGQDEWKDNDSDLDFGQPRAKRTKSSAKSPNGRSIKKEDSDNGDASDNEDASEDTNEELVATGAGFLALEDDHGSRPKTSKKTPSQNKKSLIVSLPSKMGSIKEEEDDDMSDNEGEAEATGGGLARGQSLSSSPCNQNFADLAAAQMEPAPGPINTSSYVGTYNNLHHTSPQVNAFNGGLYRNNQSLFQQSDDDIDFDYLSSGKGANIDFNSAEYLNSVGIYDTGTNGNGTYHGSTQQSDFGYQPANGYHATPVVFGDAHHGLPLSHWSNENGFAGSSIATPANQTPAENSAGADFGGYFPNAQFQADTFDGEAYDPSAGHGMASLNSGYVSDAFNNDAFNTEFYGNSSYFA